MPQPSCATCHRVLPVSAAGALAPCPACARTEAVGSLLVELSVVTPAQWAAAREKAASPDDLASVMGLLCGARAHWAPPNAPTPALTAYQRKQLTKCRADESLDRLTRLLRWKDYLLLESLGRGGMGVVYKAWDLSSRRYVAIKRTHKDSGEVRRRLRREARLQQSLNHPNIARFLGLERWRRADLLVIEYLPGSTLAELVKQRGPEKPLPWRAVAEWAVALLDALAYAHGENGSGKCVIHRDIKPGNVMLLKTPERYVPKLLDMGLAKSVGPDAAAAEVGEALTRQFQIIGTPEYMAPEMWDGGRQALPASDVYSLGGTLYFALTGQPPFGSASSSIRDLPALCLKHSNDDRPSVAAVRGDVPPRMDGLLRQMLAIEPERRGTAAALREQFQAVLAAPTTPRSSPASAGARVGPAARPAARPHMPERLPVPSAADAAGNLLQKQYAFPDGPGPASDSPPTRPATRAAVRPPLPVKSRPAVSPAGRAGLPADLLQPQPVEPFPSTFALLRSAALLIAAFVGVVRSGASENGSGEELTRCWTVFTHCVAGWLRSLGRPHQHPATFLLMLGLLVGLGFAASWVVAFVAFLLLVTAFWLSESRARA